MKHRQPDNPWRVRGHFARASVRPCRCACFVCLALVVGFVPWSVLVHGDQTSAPSRRARLPTFDNADSEDIFFADLFRQLKGDRPSSPRSGTAPKPLTTVPRSGSDSGAGAERATAATKWSELISATTIEDEVKALKISVDKSVSTPTAFAGGGHQLARHDFSILAMLFGIIEEYDAEVRFSHSAAVARARFSRASLNAKAGSSAAFNEAKQRRLDLQDLVGGAKLTGGSQPSSQPWAAGLERAPLMARLETATQDRLFPWTSRENTMSRHVDEAAHEAEMIAAIAAVLAKPSMDDAEDDEYGSLAKKMQDAALRVARAVEQGDLERVRRGVGEIRNSCAACHDSYR